MNLKCLIVLLLLTSWNTPKVTHEYFADGGGPIYSELSKQSYDYLVNKKLCRRIEHHFWIGDDLVRIETYSKDNVLLKIENLSTSFPKDKEILDQVHCIN